MIEETFNQPFKTGPLIDQRRNYALFDILMNKPMFDYIVDQQLYSQAGQQSDSNSDLRSIFRPARIRPGKGIPAGDGRDHAQGLLEDSRP